MKFDRRRFLGLAAQGGAALAASSALAACGHSPGPAPVAPTSTSTSGGASAAELRALGAALEGQLVLPSDPSYATDVQLYDERFDSIRPAAIAYCATTSDVQRVLDFARGHGLELTARSGGHSYGGYSLCPGIVADVSRMSSVSVDPSSGTALVGAGTRLIDLYDALAPHGVLVPGGSCPTVGIAGLALGGGIGVFSRRFGLTCDHLRGLEIVTADGSVRRVDASSDPDLLWASQGGGGGNFGIVTSFTFATEPIPPLSLFFYSWPYAAAPAVVASWFSWIGGTPDELWSDCLLVVPNTGGVPQCLVAGVFCGSTAACAAALQPLLGAVGTAPTSSTLNASGYLEAMLAEAGCSGMSVAACHLPSQNPAGTLSRSAFAAKSVFLDRAPAAGTIEGCVEAMGDLRTLSPQVGGGIVFDGLGGAVAAVAPEATAFVHRQALCDVQYDANWPSGSSPSLVAEVMAWLEHTETVLGPPSSGSYVNYIDPTLTNYLEAYYGANLPRLRSIKKAVDPDDVFHFAQSIPPA